jgi:hypothetical protein
MFFNLGVDFFIIMLYNKGTKREREVRKMTVRELYEWAEQNNALDFDIEIQHRDGGGFYDSADDAEPSIETRYNSWNSEKVVNL